MSDNSLNDDSLNDNCLNDNCLPGESSPEKCFFHEMRRIEHPDGSGKTIRFFANRQRAVEHICDHLLTAPECDAWRIIAPHPLLLERTETKNLRYQTAKLLNLEPEEDERCEELFETLYTLFYEIAAQEIADAARNAFFYESHTKDNQSKVLVMFSSSGALALAEGLADRDEYVLKTFFIPAQGDKGLVVRQKELVRDAKNPLPREKGERHKPCAKYRKREERDKSRRQENYSVQEQLYYLVYKPAYAFLRSCHIEEQRSFDGTLLTGADYALLKDIVPKLDFEQWCDLRKDFQ